MKTTTNTEAAVEVTPEQAAWEMLCARLQRDPAHSEETDTCSLRAAWKAMLAFVAEQSRASTPAVDRELTDAALKDAVTELLSARGERPYRVLRGGQELWETWLPAFRAAMRYLSALHPPVMGEERIRIGVWNAARARGMSDEAAMQLVEEVVGAIATLSTEQVR